MRKIVIVVLLCWTLHALPQQLDARTILRNQIAFLSSRLADFNNTMSGHLSAMYDAQLQADTYLKEHSPMLYIFTFADEANRGTTFMNAILYGMGGPRRTEIARIDNLRNELIMLEAAPRPGQVRPTQPGDVQRGGMILNGITNELVELMAFSNACDQVNWEMGQVQTALNRQDDIDRMMQQRRENGGPGIDASDRIHQNVVAQQEQIRQHLESQNQPTDSHSQGLQRDPRDLEREQRQIQRDTFPLDRQQRDTIGPIKDALERQSHEVNRSPN